MSIEMELRDIKEKWEAQGLDLQQYKSKYWKLRTVEQVNDQLETHQLSLSSMKNSPFYLTFAKEVNHWVRTLNDISETLEMLVQVCFRPLPSILTFAIS
jgi:hypothetical protein